MSRAGVFLDESSSSRPIPHLPGDPLVIGLRYTAGLGVDPDVGRVFVDTSPAWRSQMALKVDPAGRPYVEVNPEPHALVVGLDGSRPFYEKD